MSLLLDPGGFKPFQAQDIARARQLPRMVLGWDTGMGKTRGALGLAAALLEAGDVQAVLLVCESNKLQEWTHDVAKLTSMTCRLHHGPGRREALVRLGVPQVLVTTYETARADAVEHDFEDDLDGPLTAALRPLAGVLVVYDEMPKLAVAASGLYQAHRYLLEALAGVRVAGLTATPLTRDWDSVYTMFKMICPQALPLRQEFERLCVFSRDPWRTRWRPEQIRQHLLDPIAPFLLRRSKADPEVAPLFPVMREHAVHAAMGTEQALLYAAVEELGHGPVEIPGLWAALRLIAAHPAALATTAARGDSSLAGDIVEAFGAARLAAARPGKLDALLAILAPAVAAGDKAVVFSFFGPTVLPLLAVEVAQLGVPVFMHYGTMSAKARTGAIEGFRSHRGPALLLTSDAGSRGINLPEARHVVEYEGALTYLVGAQRRNRVHRLDSPHAEVHAHTLIADGTLEEPIAQIMLRRNGDTDTLLGDDERLEGFTSAEDRRALMRLWQPAGVLS